MALAGPSQEMVRIQRPTLQSLLQRGRPLLQNQVPIGGPPLQNQLPIGGPPFQNQLHIGGPLQEQPTQNQFHQQPPAKWVEIQEAVSYSTPPMSEAGHAGPSREPPPRDPLQEDPRQEDFHHKLPGEHVAIAKAIPTSNLPVAGVTQAGQSQGVLLQNEHVEALLPEFTRCCPSPPSLSEELRAELSQEVLSREKELEEAQSQERPPPGPPVN
ncbi:uncharacterized protein FTOL_06695 [Fusarium torulosum]|uniref:Uncharacterized protein n=1 Tax=Fusarium torulosum TaxID=33205 RepID=A0AAE8SIP0_9HYPO|nr:uncharacterized protein FTOL_06695 [Fusarium torulosum]